MTFDKRKELTEKREQELLESPHIPRTLYSHEIPVDKGTSPCYEGFLACLGSLEGLLGSIPCPCNCFKNPYQTVEQGQVGLITYFGKYYKTVDPGLFRIMPFTEELQKVDMKIQILTLAPQKIMTKDNVNVTVDSVVYWKIVNPFVAKFMVLDVVKALKERTIGTLRLVLGSQTVQQLIENRDALARDIEEIISPVAESWGIHVEAMLLKDLMFSKDLLDSLSSAAKQKRFAEAKIISAQAEVDAAKLMRAASDILNSAPAMQIRYLDTMVNMSRESGRNVIFMPGELAQSLSKKK